MAPTGLAGRKLPKLPMEFDTAEGQRIRVVAVTRALEYPFSVAFLPDGNMLVTERAGRLRIIRNGVLDPKPVAGGPARIGLVSPARLARSTAIWISRSIRVSPRMASFISLTPNRLMRRSGWSPSRAGVGTGTELTEVRDIFVTDQARHVAHCVRPRRHALS